MNSILENDTLPYKVDVTDWSRQTYRGVDFFIQQEHNGEIGSVTYWKFWVAGKKYGDSYIDKPGEFTPNLGVFVQMQIDDVLKRPE